MPKLSKFSSKILTVKRAKRLISVIPNNAFQAQVEIVGGGGGGGGGGGLWEYYAGGGGAGGYLNSTIVLLKDTLYNVSIGQGGPGAPVNQANDSTNNAFGQNGQDTVAFGLTALGGGGGTHRNGLEGASGGGAGGSFFNGTGGNALQGNPGGNGVRASAAGEYGGGGGGGGAGGAGAAFSGASFAAGGAGVVSTIDGITRCAGGRAGGGSVLSASVNTGSGGSGGNHTREIGVTSLAGGDGGSGIVLVKYPNSVPAPITSGLTTSTSSSGGFNILKILSGTGTIVWSEPPIYTITPNKTVLFEGESVIFNISVTNVPDDTVIYWSVSASAVTDFSLSSGTRTVTNGTVGGISLTPTSDGLSEGNESFTVILRTGSSSGTIVATSESVIIRDVPLSIGQQEFTTPGTYTWIAPEDVTSMSAVCVGGGGGGGPNDNRNGAGGGELSWYNDIPITPGESLTVVVGAGAAFNSSTPGGTSSISRGSTILVSAVGGSSGDTGVVGIGGTGGIKQGGGSGGDGGAQTGGGGAAGGGGAGGYTGQSLDTVKNWAGTFTDSTTYLSVADRNDLDLEQATHCIECWINHDLAEGKTEPSGLVNKRGPTSGDTSFWFALAGGGTTAKIYYAGWYAAGQANSGIGPTNIRAGVWTHVAMTRTGGTGPGVIRLFVNGKLDAVINEVQPAIINTNSIKIGRIDAFNSRGRWYVGKISNVRITRGSLPSGYSTTSTTIGEQVFTPSQVGLASITDTVLLTLQNSTHTDVTGLGTVTVNGTVPLAQDEFLFYAPGNGGKGSESAILNSTAGVGGAGGGGGYGRIAENDGGGGYSGGGVGLLGAGADGAAGLARQGGRGGSGGTNATTIAGEYGGGGGGNRAGGKGGVRIIWGEGRRFPSSGTANVISGQYPLITPSTEILKLTWDNGNPDSPIDLSPNQWPIVRGNGASSPGSVISTVGPYGTTDNVYVPVSVSSSYVELDRSVFTSSVHDSFFVGSKSFSLEWWAKIQYPEGDSTSRTMKIWGQAAAVGFSIDLAATSSTSRRINYFTSNVAGTQGSGSTVTFTTSNGAWTHFVVAWKAVNATQGYFYIWVDGVKIPASNSYRTKTTNEDFYRTTIFPYTTFMHMPFPSQALDVQIADFRVMNTADPWIVAGDTFTPPTSPFGA